MYQALLATRLSLLLHRKLGGRLHHPVLPDTNQHCNPRRSHSAVCKNWYHYSTYRSAFCTVESSSQERSLPSGTHPQVGPPVHTGRQRPWGRKRTKGEGQQKSNKRQALVIFSPWPYLKMSKSLWNHSWSAGPSQAAWAICVTRDRGGLTIDDPRRTNTRVLS
jgi:hypothetical protein